MVLHILVGAVVQVQDASGPLVLRPGLDLVDQRKVSCVGCCVEAHKRVRLDLTVAVVVVAAAGILGGCD